MILSNVNRTGFAASNRKLGVAFDAIYTAEDVGSYKPNRRNFDYLLEHLAAKHRVAPGEILHTAQSLFHDHVPATRAGLAKAYPGLFIRVPDLVGGDGLNCGCGV